MRSFPEGAVAVIFVNRRTIKDDVGYAAAQRVSDVDKIPDPTTDLYPAKANTTYPVDRPRASPRR